jgi:hypothetical protein
MMRDDVRKLEQAMATDLAVSKSVLAAIHRDLVVIKWMLGITIALTLLVLLVLDWITNDLTT